MSDREIEVLRLIAAGKNNKEIALDLVISISTVKFHVVNILEKMKVATRSEAVAQAVRDGLL
ncbi:MAG: response regulator transcription factor [Chloroflexi bacterium]|nr:response regulator transcription factor [Chloroflexota bacterium]